MFLMFHWENKSGMLLFPTTIYLLSQNLLSRSWFSGFLIFFSSGEIRVAKFSWKINITSDVYTSIPSSTCGCAHQRLWRTQWQLLQPWAQVTGTISSRPWLCVIQVQNTKPQTEYSHFSKHQELLNETFEFEIKYFLHWKYFGSGKKICFI